MTLPAWFDRTSNVLVSMSLLEFTISTAVTEGGAADALAVVAITLRVLFAAEYIARFFAAGRPMRYAASAVGVLDLAAVVVDEGTLKLLRALKVLAREVAVQRLWRAVADVQSELAATASCSVVLIYGSAVVMWLAEREAQPDVFGSVPAALWWSVVTLTTIGYGDAYPVTIVRRAVTGVVAIAALGMVAVPTGLIASAITRAAGNASQ